jgi:predicted site-specific integrase-resolvase
MSATSKRLLPSRIVQARYDVCSRTVKRWVDEGILPPPVVINHRNYFSESEIEQRERDRMAARPQRKTQAPHENGS